MLEDLLRIDVEEVYRTADGKLFEGKGSAVHHSYKILQIRVENYLLHHFNMQESTELISELPFISRIVTQGILSGFELKEDALNKTK